MPLSAAQFRVACDLAQLSHEQLASETGLSVRAMLALDAGEPVLDADAKNVRRAFEKHGILFTPGGVGFGSDASASAYLP